MGRTGFGILLCALLVLLPAARGEPQHDQRAMKVFDFEELAEGNREDIPRYWKKIQRKYLPQFPYYVEGQFDREVFRSANTSFQLSLNGGNVGYEFEGGRIPIHLHHDYVIKGYVKTAGVAQNGGLQEARATLSAAFTDWQGEKIAESERFSRLVATASNPDGWTEVTVYLSGRYEQARFLSVGVWLLQPQVYSAGGLGEQDVHWQDINGSAWFDDIAVYRIPRIALRTGVVGNVFAPGAAAQIVATIQGSVQSDVYITFLLESADGTEINQQRFARDGAQLGAMEYPLEFPDLPPGLYRAALRVWTHGELIAEKSLTFARCGPTLSQQPGAGDDFGVVLSADRLDRTAAELLALTGTRWVKLPIWNRALQREQLVDVHPQLDELVNILHKRDHHLVAAFADVPDVLAEELGLEQHDSVLDIFSLDADLWRPYLAFGLSRYAQRIGYWQIGSDLTADLMNDRRLHQVLNVLQGQFAALLSKPKVSIPWHGMVLPPRDLTGISTVSVTIPATVPPASTGEYIEQFQQSGHPSLWATFQTLDPTSYHRQDQLVDLARRVISAKAAGANAIFLDQPWRWRREGTTQIVEPTEMLLLYRTLSTLLGGTEYRGSLWLGPGIATAIFRKNDHGVLVVWKEAGSDEITGGPATNARENRSGVHKLLLGQNVQVIDLLGRAVPLHQGDGTSHFDVSHRPIFIYPIDPHMVELAASFRMNPPRLQANFTKHQLTVEFTNTFGKPISGQLSLRFPKGWQSSPRFAPFSLSPGATFQLPVAVRFPYNEIAGLKQLVGEFKIDADHNYEMAIATGYELGLDDVKMDVIAHITENGTDAKAEKPAQRQIVIQQIVTNLSQMPLDFFCFVAAPNRPRRERVIADLQPGEQVIKTFQFTGAEDLIGQSLRVGLTEVKGTRRLNQAVVVQ